MIKVGIIGCGKITEVRHAPEYDDNKDCELVAFFDNMHERAELLAKQYGGVACDSVEQLLAMDLDAVSVCVANVAHAQISIQALNAGKHVLCEKPMAISVDECNAMIECASKNNKQLMIGQNQRFANAHVKAHELIKSGEIGDVISFRTTFGHPGPEGWTNDKNSWFFDKKLAKFGAMADLGVHKTDLIHYLLDDEVIEVSAKVVTLDKKFPDGSPITVDDNSMCLYTTKKGALGMMHASWTFYGEEDNSTIIYGTKGCIKCYSDPKYSLIVERRDQDVEYLELDVMTSNKEQTSGGRVNTFVIDSFIDALVNKTDVVISGKEASKAMRVVLAANKSSEINQAVKVEY